MFKRLTTFAGASTALALLLALSPAVASASSTTDARITKEVTAALGPYKSDFFVRTVNGVVTISGLIESQQEKQEVLDSASNVPGVQQILSEIDLAENGV